MRLLHFVKPPSLDPIWSAPKPRFTPMLGPVYMWLHGINNHIIKHTRGYQNCNTNQILVCDGNVKVRDIVCTWVDIWVNLILNHIDTRTILSKYKGSCMTYKPEWFPETKISSKCTHPTGFKKVVKSSLQILKWYEKDCTSLTLVHTIQELTLVINLPFATDKCTICMVHLSTRHYVCTIRWIKFTSNGKLPHFPSMLSWNWMTSFLKRMLHHIPCVHCPSCPHPSHQPSNGS